MQHVTVRAAATSAREGRAFVSGFCRERAVPAEVTDDAVLLVSEVVGNAFRHARCAARICVTYEQQVLHVEVGDSSPVAPSRRDDRPDATGGRGVRLLDALATDWGVTAAPPGKVVWFDVHG